MTANERRTQILSILKNSDRWHTVAFLARHVKERRSQIAIDLRELAKRGDILIEKAHHVMEGGLSMGCRQRSVTILLARIK